MKTIIDYFDISSDCFFSAFINPIWAGEFPDSSMLDSYFMLHYGKRVAFETMLDIYAGTDGKISGNNLRLLADLVYNVNKRKWDHLFAVYEAEYSPIENTNVYEDITEDNTLNRVIDSDKADSSSLTSSTGTTASGSTTGHEDRFGFNSNNAVGDRASGATTNANTTESVSSSSSGTNTDDTTISDDEDKHLIRHKHGNIGVTENTTMLQHEVDFWKWSFIDDVCKDICNIVALSIY